MIAPAAPKPRAPSTMRGAFPVSPLRKKPTAAMMPPITNGNQIQFTRSLKNSPSPPSLVRRLPEMTPVIAVLSLIVRWLFPLVIAYEMARGMAVTRAWPRYVVAANWCAVLQVLPITIGAVVMQLVGAPPAALQVLLFVTMIWVIAVDWFVAKWALGITGKQATVLLIMMLASDAVLTQITAAILT